MFGAHINAFNAYLYAPFCSGRAFAPQKTTDRDYRFLSSTDNVPFDDTLRTKGYSTFIVLIIPPLLKKRKRLGVYFLYFYKNLQYGTYLF